MNITDREIKKLANLSIQKGEINGTIAKFVLNKLTRSQLEKYVKYLKTEISHQTVYIQVATKESGDLEKKLGEYFEGQTVEFKLDSSLGGGLKIQQTDTIIDLSLKYMIDNAVKTVKSEL